MPPYAYHLLNFDTLHYSRLYERYDLIFEPALSLEIPDCEYPTLGDFEPFIVEALLQPPEPFQVFKAKVVPRRLHWCASPDTEKFIEEYKDGQGKLSGHNRQEISIICTPKYTVRRLRSLMLICGHLHFNPIVVYYLSIPWKGVKPGRTGMAKDQKR